MGPKTQKFIPQIPQLDLSEGAEMLTDFSHEAQRHLISARNSLLVLEAMPSDKEAIENIFKTFHTIRGLADFLNLRDIFALTNEVEALLDMVRKNILVMEESVFSLVQESIANLQQLLELLDEQISDDGKLKSSYLDMGELIASIKNVTSKKPSQATPPKSKRKAIPTIKFEPDMSICTQIKKEIKENPLTEGKVVITSETADKLISDFEQTNNELKETQSKLQERQRELIKERELAIKLTQQAQSDARAKSEYLANMSHEIRTLINAILGFTDILRSGMLSEKQREHLNTIIVSGKMLLEIVNDILDFSKVEAGKLKLENISFNLDGIIEEAFKIIRTRASGKPINLFFDIKEDVPRKVFGDPTRLKQIFLNLLDNAIKFTEEGGIGLEVCLDAEQGAFENTQAIRFCISDSGIGIPENHRQMVFESYTQATSSTTRLYGGTGLGLALCKTLVQKMGGKIWVESELGKGSQFIFILNLAVDDISVATKKPDTSLTFPKAEVIIVDDHPRSSDALATLCKKALMPVLPVATTAKQASETLIKHEANKKSLPSVIFIDTLLPKKEGFMLAYKIRQQNRYQNVKLVALSSDVKMDAHSDFNQAGFDALLAKPIMNSEFIDLMSHILERRGVKRRYISHDVLNKISCEGIQILVAEDSIPNQELLKVHLESLGCLCDYASNGQEAIDLLKNKKYDVCFMDLHMPVLDGLKATKIIREELKLDTPIVALTAAEIQEEKERCFKIGMNDYLAKPFDISELKEKIIKCTRM